MIVFWDRKPNALLFRGKCGCLVYWRLLDLKIQIMRSGESGVFSPCAQSERARDIVIWSRQDSLSLLIIYWSRTHVRRVAKSFSFSYSELSKTIPTISCLCDLLIRTFDILLTRHWYSFECISSVSKLFSYWAIIWMDPSSGGRAIRTQNVIG